MYRESERVREERRKTLARIKRALKLTGQPTTLRRCLQCEWWMRSTGPDHQICNHCKNVRHGEFVGSRVNF